ncbi:hypothetical protein F4805DRAFT_321284 [Annulohypoxylon moriforme]|nr:hypothetical protein F4805DRAFT_321284 [Annulohypoxylon moriforme]
MSVVDENLPAALAMAGFAGVSWCLGVEISVSLLLLFKRRRGLYFWSCAIGIWGVILQTLFIILADFRIWTQEQAPIVFIYLTWAMMVISQSWILFSRLHLLIEKPKILSWIRVALVFTSVVIGTITITLGTIAQTAKPSLFPTNNIWDRFQTAVFFVQETALSILYIWQTRTYIRDLGPLLTTSSSSTITLSRIAKKKTMLHQLLYINVLVICLDVTLLGIQNANLFYLAGAFKPAVYGAKLKLEFVILNRLIKTLPSRRGARSTLRGSAESPGAESAIGGGGPDEISRPWEAYTPTKPHTAEHTFHIE